MVALALLCLVACAITCCIRIGPLNKFATDHVRGGQVWLTRVAPLVDCSAWIDAFRSTWPPRVAEVAAEHDDWRLSDQIKSNCCHLPDCMHPQVLYCPTAACCQQPSLRCSLVPSASSKSDFWQGYLRPRRREPVPEGSVVRGFRVQVSTDHVVRLWVFSAIVKRDS